MPPHCPPTTIPPSLDSVSPTSVTEISTLITECTNSYCDLDPIPTSLLNSYPLLSHPPSTILSTFLLPQAPSHPHRHLPLSHHFRKIPSFDNEDLTNYRPISNLSTISKITERVVKTRLNHLSSSSRLNPYQSAYSKNYSTETTLLSLHDHLSNAIAHQQVSCLCLFDLSAALDTLDHSILLNRMSTWFGISSISLSWFRSYLSTRVSSRKNS